MHAGGIQTQICLDMLTKIWSPYCGHTSLCFNPKIKHDDDDDECQETAFFSPPMWKINI